MTIRRQSPSVVQHLENLTLCCQSCNLAKTSKTLEEFLRWRSRARLTNQCYSRSRRKAGPSCPIDSQIAFLAISPVLMFFAPVYKTWKQPIPEAWVETAMRFIAGELE